jgi:hypothetical protein
MPMGDKRGVQNAGAALIWAVCALLILTLVVGGIGAVAARAHGRSLRDAQRRQAALTARAAVDAVLALGDAVDFSAIPVGGSVAVADFDFPAAMGSITAGAIARPEAGVCVVSATATVGETARSLSARLTLEGGGWRFARYTEGQP